MDGKSMILEKTVTQFENSLNSLDLKENKIEMNNMTGIIQDDDLEKSARGEGEEVPVDENVVIPIDEPDGKLKAIANRQANTYAAKKTVAQGMMDIALITANANQLRYIVEYTSGTKTYYINLCLISLSLLLQMAVGVTLIFKGRLDLRGESKMARARKMNNYVVVGVFLVTIINVFIASFTITGNKAETKVALPSEQTI